MTKTIVQGKLITGIGDGYLQKMTSDGLGSKPIAYDDNIYQVPSIDKVAFKGDSKTKPIYLSNKKVADLGKYSSVELTVDFGWFPPGFIEEMTGMKKLADGSYVQGDSPVAKNFRWAFPVTDQDGSEIIYNFPKCQIEPIDFNAETETDDKKEQMQQVKIKAYALVIKGGTSVVYSKLDTRVNNNYDRDKLLEVGFYDETTLKACLKSGGTDTTALPTA